MITKITTIIMINTNSYIKGKKRNATVEERVKKENNNNDKHQFLY